MPVRGDAVRIALFRGINVGGKNALSMKDLAAVLQHAGATHVKTYIQSGNAVFLCTGDPAHLCSAIERALDQRRGLQAHVLVLDRAALQKTMRDNPFPEAVTEPQRLYVAFLALPPTAPDLDALAKIAVDGERFELRGGTFYLHAPAGVGRSKLAAAIERRLGVPTTMRNWRTVCALHDMAEDLARAHETGRQS